MCGVFFFRMLRPPRSTHFPYTSLFRSMYAIGPAAAARECARVLRSGGRFVAAVWAGPDVADIGPRSEEHTSELQSRLHLVCRLLLEKKKNRIDAATTSCVQI